MKRVICIALATVGVECLAMIAVAIRIDRRAQVEERIAKAVADERARARYRTAQSSG